MKIEINLLPGRWWTPNAMKDNAVCLRCGYRNIVCHCHWTDREVTEMAMDGVRFAHGLPSRIARP